MAMLLLISGVMGISHAEESSKIASLKSWFQHLKEGLSESAVADRYQKGAKVTAVAAVRGSPQEAVNPDKPAWKTGKKSKKDALCRAEMRELSQVADFALEGKTAEAEQTFAAFKAAHPKPLLAKEVQEIEAKLAELKAAR
ncbi:MAG: hypothetical protein HY921_02930 [Elusimicrobia bacterium]|nr:hypothetical protein [Elusimicrobiota bacterium]